MDLVWMTRYFKKVSQQLAHRKQNPPSLKNCFRRLEVPYVPLVNLE